MKQKTRFKIFGNIGYRSMNGRYIGIGPQKAISVDLYYFLLLCQKLASPVNWTRYRFIPNLWYSFCTNNCSIDLIISVVKRSINTRYWFPVNYSPSGAFRGKDVLNQQSSPQFHLLTADDVGHKFKVSVRPGSSDWPASDAESCEISSFEAVSGPVVAGPGSFYFTCRHAHTEQPCGNGRWCIDGALIIACLSPTVKLCFLPKVTCIAQNPRLNDSRYCEEREETF